MLRKFFQFFNLRKEKIFLGAILILFSLNFLTWRAVFKNIKKPDIEIYFFDVGQGDASFIESKDGSQILIDGGPPNKILSKLSNVLDFNDRDLDVLIVTHPHTDHISGAIEVLQNYKISMVIESGIDYHTAEAEEFERLVYEKKIKRIMIDKPVNVKFFNGAKIKFLYPDKSFAGKIIKNAHEANLISEFSYKGKKIIFMGDAEKNIEKYLIDKNLVDDVDILKAGHHGSKTSTGKEFLLAVQPEYSIIEVGRNSYGHPTQEVLSRLASIGSKIFRTDIDGTIKFEIDFLGNLKFSKENVR